MARRGVRGSAQGGELRIEAVQADESRLAAVEDWAEARLALGGHDEVVGLVRAQVAGHPLRERLWARLMVAQYRCGRPAEALESYAVARATLRDELGLEPGPGLRELHQAVLSRDPALEQQGAAGVPVGSVSWPVCQLPPDAADFTGRDAVVRRVAALMEPDGAAVPVVVLTGLPGVGKSTLATRVAHLLRPSFPDGQLYVQLAGASAHPRAPGTVLADLLRTLGVVGTGIPESVSDRAAMFRSVLSDRRVLVVLDDAGDSAQVRPLLPGTPGCAVLVTSRARLAGVAGMRLVDVDLFADADSRALLRRIVGTGRLEAEPGATDRMLASCGGLPLALRVVGARLATRPGWPVRYLADKLADERGRLAELAVGDLAVRASVALSYCGLDAGAAAVFRAVGMLPSWELSGWVLAALLDTEDVESGTEALLDANLVRMVGVDALDQPRYRMHDLLHAFAAECAAGEPSERRRSAVHRALEGWLSVARLAGDHMPEVRRAVRSEHQPGAWRPGAALVRRVVGDPVGWLEGERANLVAAVELAADAGHGSLAIGIASAMDDISQLRSWWDDWMRVARTALRCAETDGDLAAVAAAHGSLARAHASGGRISEAMPLFATGIELYDRLGDRHRAAYLRVHRCFWSIGPDVAESAQAEATEAMVVMTRCRDRHGQALALRSLGYALPEQRRYPDAIRALTAGLRIAERIGYPLASADLLQALASAEKHCGRFTEAGVHARRALADYRVIGHRPGEAYSLLVLAGSVAGMGAAEQALPLLEEAVTIFGELRERHGEALALYKLGKTHAVLRETGLARKHLDTALSAFHTLRMSDRADRARTELAKLTEPRAADPRTRPAETDL